MSGARTFYAVVCRKTWLSSLTKKGASDCLFGHAPRERFRGEISLEVKAPSARTFVHLAGRRSDFFVERVGADAPSLRARHGLRPEPRRRPRRRSQARERGDRRDARDEVWGGGAVRFVISAPRHVPA